MKKQIVIFSALVVILAISITCVFCFGFKDDYMKNKQTVQFISTAIRSLKDSQFKDRELIKNIYRVAFSQTAVVTDNFPENLEETLPTIKDGLANTELLNSVPDGLYGGKLVKGAISGIESQPTSSIKQNDLYVGDLLFIKTNKDTKYYIYDKDGFVDLSEPLVSVDTKEVLKNIPNSDIFAVFRLMKIMKYDFIKEKSLKVKLNNEQEAVIETAKSYLLRGDKLQYADTRFSNGGEFRWKTGERAPEDYSSTEWGYTNCAAFVYDVYYNALDYPLDYGTTKLNTTANLTSLSEELGIRMYHMDCQTSDFYSEKDKERIKKEIFDILQPADILVVRRNGNGHAMLYIGGGNIIHSSGSVYDYNQAKENYEATVQQIRFKDYFFTEGGRGYLFGSDTGVNVSSFTIVRPLKKWDYEIPQNTKNRVKNMKGIMAQKISSHNSARTVNASEEITFTFEIYNTNDKEVKLEIKDTIPTNTKYLSGAQKQNKNILSWVVTIPANTRINKFYKVKVKSDAKAGDIIKGQKCTIGGVAVNCGDIIVNKTLTKNQQEKIKNTVQNLKSQNSGFALVNEIYKKALNTDDVFKNTHFDNVYKGKDGVFAYDEYSLVAPGAVRPCHLNKNGKYRNLLVPTMYGGRGYDSIVWTDRTRLPREHNLVIGDILIRKTSTENQIFIYVGQGEFYNLTYGIKKDIVLAEIRLETTLATSDCYAILRPSFNMK